MATAAVAICDVTCKAFVPGDVAGTVMADSNLEVCGSSSLPSVHPPCQQPQGLVAAMVMPPEPAPSALHQVVAPAKAPAAPAAPAAAVVASAVLGPTLAGSAFVVPAAVVTRGSAVGAQPASSVAPLKVKAVVAGAGQVKSSAPSKTAKTSSASKPKEAKQPKQPKLVVQPVAAEATTSPPAGRKNKKRARPAAAEDDVSSVDSEDDNSENDSPLRAPYSMLCKFFQSLPFAGLQQTLVAVMESGVDLSFACFNTVPSGGSKRMYAELDLKSGVFTLEIDPMVTFFTASTVVEKYLLDVYSNFVGAGFLSTERSPVPAGPGKEALSSEALFVDCCLCETNARWKISQFVNKIKLWTARIEAGGGDGSGIRIRRDNCWMLKSVLGRPCLMEDVFGKQRSQKAAAQHAAKIMYTLVTKFKFEPPVLKSFFFPL